MHSLKSHNSVLGEGQNGYAACDGHRDLQLPCAILSEAFQDLYHLHHNDVVWLQCEAPLFKEVQPAS